MCYFGWRCFGGNACARPNFQVANLFLFWKILKYNKICLAFFLGRLNHEVNRETEEGYAFAATTCIFRKIRKRIHSLLKVFAIYEHKGRYFYSSHIARDDGNTKAKFEVALIGTFAHLFDLKLSNRCWCTTVSDVTYSTCHKPVQKS